MKRRSPLGRPLALGALSLAFALTACGRVPGQFEILSNQLPSAGGTGCTASVGGMTIGEGKLDLSIVQPQIGTAYFVFPLIQNNLPKPTGSSGADPNMIALTGFQIDIHTVNVTPAAQAVFDGATMDTHYQVSWSGSIASGGAQASAIVPAFPIDLAQKLQAMNVASQQPSLTVDLQIEAVGMTTSGTSMTSDPFHFPLQLCSGCLVANVAPCPYTAAAANPGNVCNPAQDDKVDCCTSNGALVCPPTVGP